MRSSFRCTLPFISALLCIFLFAGQQARAARLPRALAARQAATPQAVPMPGPAQMPQILAARKIFLSNHGVDGYFPATSETTYQAVYNSLQSWGYYQLVATPAEADLIFNLSGVAPVSYSTDANGNSTSYSSPALKLSLVDPATNTTLWSVDSPVTTAVRQKNRSKWFAIAVGNLTSKVKMVAAQPLTPQESKQLIERPKSHPLLLVSLILLPLVLGGVATYIAKKHADDFATKNGLTCATNPFFCTH